MFLHDCEKRPRAKLSSEEETGGHGSCGQKGGTVDLFVTMEGVEYALEVAAASGTSFAWTRFAVANHMSGEVGRSTDS